MADGAVMNRVSMSMRADSPGWAGTFRSVKIPPTCGFFSDGEGPGGAGYADELRTRAAGVGPGVQHAARAGGDGRARRHRRHRIAERDHDRVLVGAHEKPVFAGVHATGWQGRDHQSAVGRQGGHRRAGDGDVQRARRPGHQWGGDLRDVPIGSGALRPQDGGRGLFHRKQGHQDAQQQARDSGDDGDQPRYPLRSLITVLGHEGRS